MHSGKRPASAPNRSGPSSTVRPASCVRQRPAWCASLRSPHGARSKRGQMAGKQADEIVTKVRGPMTGAGPTEQAVYAGLESVGVTAPSLAAGAMTGSPNLALGIMGAATAGESYAEDRAAGVSPLRSAADAGVQGATEILTELMPASRLLGDLAKRTGIMKTILRQVAVEVPGEQVAELVQSLSRWTAQSPEKPLSEWAAERKDAAAATFVATIVGTVVQAGGAVGLQRLTQPRSDQPAPPGDPPPPAARTAAPPPVVPPTATRTAEPSPMDEFRVAPSPAAPVPPSAVRAAPASPQVPAPGVSSVESAGDRPTATFIGWQEDVDERPAIPLYNVQGGDLDGSTVSTETLVERGIAVPETSAKDVSPPKPERDTHSFSTTQVNLPAAHAARIVQMAQAIPDEDIAEDGRAGDSEGSAPHVTVKYGIHSTDVEDVRTVLADEPPIVVTLGATSFFPNSESGSGDVLKIDVDSPDLHRLNAKIADALKTTETHPTYIPHVSLAYLKPGKGKQYEGDDSLKGQTMTLDTLTFSTKDGKIFEIPLTGTSSFPST